VCEYVEAKLRRPVSLSYDDVDFGYKNVSDHDTEDVRRKLGDALR